METIPKIVHLSSLSLDRGGIEHVILQITSSLAPFYNFDLLATTNKEYKTRFKETCQGDVYQWGMKKILDFPQIGNLDHLLTRIKPNLVHIHDARVGVIARPLLKIKKIPSLITVHLPPYYYQWKKNSRLRQLFYAWGDAMLNYATPTHIVYVAETTFEHALKKRYSPPNRSHVFTNGIDLSTFNTNIDLEKRSHRVIICCIARLSPQKNIPLLIQAATILQNKGYDFSLWLIGNGKERDELEKLVKQNDLVNKVHFWGSKLDVLPYLRKADIFVLTSNYETHPLSIMEAQAVGLPCVLSSVGDHQRMVSNPHCGYTFRSGDVAGCVEYLEKLIVSQELRVQLGRNAQQKAWREHSKELMVKKYDTLYQTLLESKM